MQLNRTSLLFLEPDASRTEEVPSPNESINWFCCCFWIICSVIRLFRVDEPRGASQIWNDYVIMCYVMHYYTLHLYKFRGFLNVQTGQSQLSSRNSSWFLFFLLLWAPPDEDRADFEWRPISITIQISEKKKFRE